MTYCSELIDENQSREATGLVLNEHLENENIFRYYIRKVADRPSNSNTHNNLLAILPLAITIPIAILIGIGITITLATAVTNAIALSTTIAGASAVATAIAVTIACAVALAIACAIVIAIAVAIIILCPVLRPGLAHYLPRRGFAERL